MNGTAHAGQDCLLDLANHLLPDAERDAVLAHLHACPSCAAELRTIAGTHERAYARGAEALSISGTAAGTSRNGVSRRHAGREIRRDEASSPRRAVRHARGARGVLALAAALVVVAGAGAALWSLRRPSAEAVGDVAWLPAPEASVLVRDFALPPADPRFSRGLAAYRLHDARSARRLLESAETHGALEQVRLVYLGNAQLQLGDAHAASRTLGALDLRLVPEPWRGEAQWSLALALSSEGRTAQADSVRRLLAARSDGIGDRARAVLEGSGPGPASR